MAYISSNANRWYCGRETEYGQIPSITAANRIPAVKLTAQQQRAKSQRKDKTGSRTFMGLPIGMRLQTGFDLTSYMRDWPDPTVLPSHGPCSKQLMGAAGVLWSGTQRRRTSTASTIAFATAHGLAPGQALTSAGEIRFVAAIADAMTIVLNAPFSAVPDVGAPIGQTATYSLATQLPSVSIFDYWDPSTAVQRILTGAAIDKMSVKVNGDFHQFEFKGTAQDVIDSASFVSDQGGTVTYPPEPTLGSFSYSIVPGNLGQVWLGVVPTSVLHCVRGVG